MMDTHEEIVTLDLEESNELAFKIKVEGSAPAPAKVRLVCDSADMSYMFNGYGTGDDGVVQFVLPQMKDKLSEGMYQARVEVLIENRYFAPVQFQINFKKAIKVVAEAIQFAPRPKKQEISVSVTPIAVQKQSPNVSIQQPVQHNLVVENEKSVTHNVLNKSDEIKPRTPDVSDVMLSSKQSSSMTLKERYNAIHKTKKETEDSVIRELARSFIRGKRR